jgi:ribosomal protein L7/L12
MPIHISEPVTPGNVYFRAQDILAHVSDGLNETQYGRQYIDGVLAVAKHLCSFGRTIQAIKLVKTCFPMGLAEAKNFVESEFATTIQEWRYKEENKDSKGWSNR